MCTTNFFPWCFHSDLVTLLVRTSWLTYSDHYCSCLLSHPPLALRHTCVRLPCAFQNLCPPTHVHQAFRTWHRAHSRPLALWWVHVALCSLLTYCTARLTDSLSSLSPGPWDASGATVDSEYCTGVLQYRHTYWRVPYWGRAQPRAQVEQGSTRKSCCSHPERQKRGALSEHAA